MGSSNLPSLSQARIMKALGKLGYPPMKNTKGASRGKGGHQCVRGPSGRPVVIQSGTLPPTFLATILKQLGIAEQDFLDAL
jgi:predicted RNA binding protein YcfA (HicA-like mRNA interferase family)